MGPKPCFSQFVRKSTGTPGFRGSQQGLRARNAWSLAFLAGQRLWRSCEECEESGRGMLWFALAIGRSEGVRLLGLGMCECEDWAS